VATRIALTDGSNASAGLHLPGCTDFMSGQVCAIGAADCDRTEFSRLRFRKVFKQVKSSQFENSFALFARDTFEIVEKLFQRLAGRQRIKQGLDWNARSVETRRTFDSFGINPNKTEQWIPRLDQISDEMLWGNWSYSLGQRSIDELGYRVENLKVLYNRAY
jgi:hypothetical protein